MVTVTVTRHITFKCKMKECKRVALGRLAGKFFVALVHRPACAKSALLLQARCDS